VAVNPMPHAHRSAGAHAVRPPRRTAQSRRRAWRLRSRRAQVSAVAVILGLLLVVTFIANYLSTSLPNTMAQNDLQHEVTVQNQVAQLGALIQRTAEAGAVGAQVSQPIALGSAAAPPFAGQDGATIGTLPTAASFNVSFTLLGTLDLPNGGTPNYGTLGSTCTPTLPLPYKAIVCTGSTSMNWNFSAGNGVSYWVNGTGGLSAQVNFTTSNSVITVGQVGGANNVVGIFGNGNKVTVTGKGGCSVTLVLVGNNNTVHITSTGAAAFTVLVVGNYDTVWTSASGSGSGASASFYGGHDTFSGNETSTAYFTGYNIQNPSNPQCPYDNQATSDNVAGSGPGTVYYNNTNYSGPGGSLSGWTFHYSNTNQPTCPFIVTSSVSQTQTGTGFVVGLHNTYAPTAEVAYDEGAVVYAQPGSTPIFIVPPSISFINGTLSLLVPKFVGGVGSEAGVGTADVSLRLLSAQLIELPSNGASLNRSSPITITIETPYASAWYSYFRSYATLQPYVTCTPSSVCSPTFLYEPGGPLGTVTLTIPATGLLLEMLVAAYSITIE